MCSDYKELSRLASLLIKKNILVISYTRNGNDPNLKCSYFNIVGCLHVLDHIINIIHNRYKLPIHIVGISAGTSLAASYLGKKNKHVKSAILISPGYSFKYSMYNMPLIPSILCYLQVYYKFKRYSNNVLLKSKNLVEYCDSLYTQYHYKNKKEFYKDHDPIHYLKHIKVPCYFINADDDFVFPIQSIKKFIKSTIKQNPNIGIINLNYGSHNSFKYKLWKYPWIYLFILEHFDHVNE